MSLNTIDRYHHRKLFQYKIRKKRCEVDLHPPYRVDGVDMFEGHSGDGYFTIGIYDEPPKAIEVARKFTEEALESVGGKVSNWLGIGDAGLV